MEIPSLRYWLSTDAFWPIGSFGLALWLGVFGVRANISKWHGRLLAFMFALVSLVGWYTIARQSEQADEQSKTISDLGFQIDIIHDQVKGHANISLDRFDFVPTKIGSEKGVAVNVYDSNRGEIQGDLPHYNPISALTKAPVSVPILKQNMDLLVSKTIEDRLKTNQPSQDQMIPNGVENFFTLPINIRIDDEKKLELGQLYFTFMAVGTYRDQNLKPQQFWINQSCFIYVRNNIVRVCGYGLNKTWLYEPHKP